MAILREIIAKFGVEFDDAPLKKGSQRMARVRSGLKKLGVGFAAAGAAAAVVVNHIQTLSSEISKLANETGESTEAIQRFQFAFQQLTGEKPAIGNMVQEVNKRLQEARDGSEDAARAFRKVGVPLDTQKEGIELIEATTNGLGQLESATEQASAADKIFAGEAQQVLSVVRQGRGAFNEQLEIFEKMGGGISEGAIEKMEGLRRSLNIAKTGVEGLASEIIGELFPALRDDEAVAEFIGQLREFEKQTGIIKASILALGGVIVGVGIAAAIAWYPVTIALGIITVGAVALTLVLTDLIALFEGGKSVIGEFFQEFLGVDAAAILDEMIAPLYNVETRFDALTATFKNTWDSFTIGVLEARQEIARLINKGLTPLINIANKIPGIDIEQPDVTLGGENDQQRIQNLQQDILERNADIRRRFNAEDITKREIRRQREINRQRVSGREKGLPAQTSSQLPGFFGFRTGQDAVSAPASAAQTTQRTLNINKLEVSSNADNPKEVAQAVVNEILRRELEHSIGAVGGE